ncbi:MAG TPA: CpsD/CapB family tyrosine-protein kinase [Terriglobales bacterium]|nr:CpsD/CapB family tyrosine-protein kinase [Terriglobales bacterium]
MSRFFSQARKMQPGTENSVSNVSVTDAEKLLEGAQDRIRKSFGPESRNTDSSFASLAGVGGERIAAGLHEFRLEECEQLKVAHLPSAKMFEHDDELTQGVVEAYRGLRTRIARIQATQGLTTLVISSAVKGEGKSYTALNLALCCAQLRNANVLLVDADLRTAGVSRNLAAHERTGLSEVLEGKARYAEAILKTDLSNLFVLPAGTSNVPPPELFASSAWKEFISWTNETFRLVIIDATPVLPLADYDLIAAPCDAVIAIVRPHVTPRELVERAVPRFDKKKFLGVVCNGTEVHNDHRYYYRYYAPGR